MSKGGQDYREQMLIADEEIEQYRAKTSIWWDVALLVVVLWIAYIFAHFVMYLVHEIDAPQVSNRGCEASAYQAAKNGFSLEDNLKVCYE